MLKHKNVLCGVAAESAVREFPLFSEFIFPTTLSPTHVRRRTLSRHRSLYEFFYIMSVYNAFVSIYVRASSCIVYRSGENEKKNASRFNFERRAETKNWPRDVFLLLPHRLMMKIAHRVLQLYARWYWILLTTFNQRAIRNEKSWSKSSRKSFKVRLLLRQSIGVLKTVIEFDFFPKTFHNHKNILKIFPQPDMMTNAATYRK